NYSEGVILEYTDSSLLHRLLTPGKDQPDVNAALRHFKNAFDWTWQKKRGDGVAGIKRRRCDLPSDGVMDLTTASGHTPLVSPFLDSDDDSDDGEVWNEKKNMHAQPKDSNELFQKLLKDLKELAEEECCIEVSEEQKQNMEDTILEKSMHDNVDDLIESALNSKLLLINSQRLNKKKQEVKNIVEQPAERRTYEIIKSGVEELVPILSENEVTSEDKKECDMLICENSPICDNHSEIFFDSKNDDDISSDDDDFEDIEYVKASLPDPETVSVEEENDVHQEEEEFDLKEIQDVVLCEKLLSINHLIANIESLNDNPTPDCRVRTPSLTLAFLFRAGDEIIKSGVEELVPILSENEVTSEDKKECDMLVCENSPICDDHSEIFSDSKNDDDISKSDNSLSDNFSPEFETFCDHTEETRSGNTTTHANDPLPDYDSFCFKIEPDQERLISVVKNDISDDSSNDPLLEEADLFLASDN
nr:DNA mismatch repair protein MSH6 [Tanacetum cinerariifolium]